MKWILVIMITALLEACSSTSTTGTPPPPDRSTDDDVLDADEAGEDEDDCLGTWCPTLGSMWLCVDLMTDPQHCGHCNLDCPGYPDVFEPQCEDGRCVLP